MSAPFEPMLGSGNIYLPSYRDERVLLALDVHSAQIVRLLEWRAGAPLSMDTQGEQLLFGKADNSQTSVFLNVGAIGAQFEGVAAAVYAKAKENGREVMVGKFPFTANGKAVALGETDGFVKVVADKATGEILGVHIAGPEATEIIHEFAVGRTLEATLEEIMHTIHAHPTLSEAALEATLAALGQAIASLSAMTRAATGTSSSKSGKISSASTIAASAW